MSLGVEVQTRTAPPARGFPTDTDMLFLAFKSGSGSLTAVTRIRSLADFVAAYGARATGSTNNALAYDYLDAFFREGGRQAIVARYNDTGTIDAGLALFTKDLGPGQVAAPYETPGATTFGKLRTHAINNDRVALYDVALTDDTEAELATQGAAIPANDEYGLLTGPWANIPAPAGVISGSARQVPGSAITAALIARSDALGNPNRAAAGRDFPLQYVDSFVYLPTDDDRVTLLNAGVNLFSERYGVLQLYGFQTALPQNSDNPFWQFNTSRARMWLIARAKAVGENFMFKPIDGQGRLARALQGAIAGVCLDLYSVDGLYGDTPQDAFAVEVGAAVNSVSSIAQGELHAVVEARFSMHSKRVLVELVSVPITGRVSTAQ